MFTCRGGNIENKGFLGEQKCFEIIENTLECAESLFNGQTEIRICRQETSSIYFSQCAVKNSQIIDRTLIIVRVVYNNRIGMVYTTFYREDFSEKGLLKKAIKAARLSEKDMNFKSLPDGDGRVHSFDYGDRETAEYPAEQQIEDILEMAEAAERIRKAVQVDAAHYTHTFELAVGNSEGIKVHSHLNRAYISARSLLREGSTARSESASQIARSVKELNCSTVGEISAQRCAASQHPSRIKSGVYEAVVEPRAVSSVIKLVGFLGFSAYDYLQKKSFSYKKLGKKILDEKITLYDDGGDPAGLVIPFDLEGVLKQKVVLVERGIIRNVVYDSYTAHMVGKKSTGHSNQYLSYSKPFPTNIFLEKGNTTIEKMIENTERGILISDIPISQFRDPRLIQLNMALTGKSWLIEHGEVKYPVGLVHIDKNPLGLLSSVEAVGGRTELSSENEGTFGCWSVPALKLKDVPLSCKVDSYTKS